MLGRGSVALWRGGHESRPHARAACDHRAAWPSRRCELPTSSAGDPHGSGGAAGTLFSELLLHPRDSQLRFAMMAPLRGVSGLAAKRVFAGRGDPVALAVAVDGVDAVVPKRGVQGVPGARAKGLNDHRTRLRALGGYRSAAKINKAVLDQCQLGPLGTGQLRTARGLGGDVNGETVPLGFETT